MTRPIPALAVDFIKRAEACKLVAYQDSAGVWTVGVGHVGPEVGQGLVITQAQADADLAADLAAAAARLALCVRAPVLAALAEHQYAALLSFVFNLGAEPGWTIWKLLNAGRIDAAPDQIKRFDKARDPRTGRLVDVPGLLNRRVAEIALWNTPDVNAALLPLAAAPPAPPSSQTRVADTPPAPAPVEPLARSKSFAASAATAAAAAAGAAAPLVQQAAGGVKQVSDAISPYAGASDPVAKVQHGLMMALAVLAAVATALVWLKHKQAAEA